MQEGREAKLLPASYTSLPAKRGTAGNPAYSMAIFDDHGGSCVHEDAWPNGETMSGGTAGEVLTRIELESAYSSEKLLNLEILLLRVEDIATDYESLVVEIEDFPEMFVKKAFEFDILSGILNSEVNELDYFMASLQIEIMDACQKLSLDDNLEESSKEIEEKLHDTEKSLKQSQDRIADMKAQLSKFERTSAFSWHATRIATEKEIENSHLLTMDARWKSQTVEQQRHFLQLLEKSLARELDLEKKLTDSKNNEEELRLKLQYAEGETYEMEESMAIILERLFEAENVAEVLLGISKDFVGKLQTVQFNLKSSVQRECEIRSQLQESMLRISAEESTIEKLKATNAELDKFLVSQVNDLKAKLTETEDMCTLANSEATTLRRKVSLLEEQLREAESQLELGKVSAEESQQQQKMLNSEICETEHIIEDLKGNVLKTEIRAQDVEAKFEILTKTNMELDEELHLLKSKGAEKANVLERKLKESDTELWNAKASVEAIEEQHCMLYSTLNDMGNLIEDLKAKVSKAESRAENAESKCSLLAETNLELNEELGFLRGRLECLETSLHQTDDVKMATAKDIGIKTKIIAELVAKLALERERLQLEMSALTKENKVLLAECLRKKNDATIRMTDNGTCRVDEYSLPIPIEEASTEFSSGNDKVEKSASAMSVHEMPSEERASGEDALAEGSELETVRSIDATQLNLKYLLVSILILLGPFLASYYYN